MSASTRDPRSELRKLAEVSRAITYERPLDTVLSLAVDNAMQLVDAEKAVLMLGEGSDRLSIRAARGVPPEIVEQFAEPADEALVSRLSHVFGEGAGERFLGVPLVVQGRVVGLLASYLRESRAVSESDEWLLSALADQTSVALHDALLTEARTRLETELDELRDQGERKDEAMQIVSHDVRSPLQAILGYLELMGGGTLGPLTGMQREILNRMRSICRHLSALLDGVVEMSRLSGGKVHFDIRPTLAREAAREAIDITTPAAEHAGIDLKIEALDGIYVLADPDRLRQLLVQLLDNAVKFGPEDSAVLVRIRRLHHAPEPSAAIEVVDQGPGVPPELRLGIFEPYRRRSGASARSRAGLGLGLAIAKRLVEDMGGSLGLECPAEGGSVFTVRLRHSLEAPPASESVGEA